MKTVVTNIPTQKAFLVLEKVALIIFVVYIFSEMNISFSAHWIVLTVIGFLLVWVSHGEYWIKRFPSLHRWAIYLVVLHMVVEAPHMCQEFFGGHVCEHGHHHVHAHYGLIIPVQSVWEKFHAVHLLFDISALVILSHKNLRRLVMALLVYLACSVLVIAFSPEWLIEYLKPLAQAGAVGCGLWHLFK